MEQTLEAERVAKLTKTSCISTFLRSKNGQPATIGIKFYDGFSPRHAEPLLDQMANLLERALSHLDRAEDLSIQEAVFKVQIDQLDRELTSLNAQVAQEHITIDEKVREQRIRELDAQRIEAQVRATHLEKTQPDYDNTDVNRGGWYIRHTMVAAANQLTPSKPDPTLSLSEAIDQLNSIQGGLGSLISNGRTLPMNAIASLAAATENRMLAQKEDRMFEKSVASARWASLVDEIALLEEGLKAFRSQHATKESIQATRSLLKKLNATLQSGALALQDEIHAAHNLALDDVLRAAARKPAVDYGLTNVYGLTRVALPQGDASIEMLLKWVRSQIDQVMILKHSAKQGVATIPFKVSESKGRFTVQSSMALPKNCRVVALTVVRPTQSWTEHLQTVKLSMPKQIRSLAVQIKRTSEPQAFPPQIDSERAIEETFSFTISPIIPLGSPCQPVWLADSEIHFSSPFGDWHYESEGIDEGTELWLLVKYVLFGGSK